MIPFFLMAYLSRRQDTFHLGLSLLPLVICVVLKTFIGFVHTEPERNIYSWGQGAGLLNYTDEHDWMCFLFSQEFLQR